MTQPYDLTQLDPNSFEHLVNFIALKVLGNSATGFSIGPDGGRDGYFKGKADYPSREECWDGIWYIQSKFHKPNLSSNSQKWLEREVIKEIKSYRDSNKRKMPDIWIIATNIEPSGVPKTGAYDKIIALVNKYSPQTKVDVWGGRKILDYLLQFPAVAQAYGHFLTPGHIISQLYNLLDNNIQKRKYLIDNLIVNNFRELSYTKLEQAGSGSDQRPKIYELFRDLPVRSDYANDILMFESLVKSSCNVQKISVWNNFGIGWRDWIRNPIRTRVFLLKGGPGQGKSTIGQYFSQIQRAAFILSDKGPSVIPQVKEIALELKQVAEESGYWPSIPRIPLFIELKDYANWYISRSEHSAKNVSEYLCYKINYRNSYGVDVNTFNDTLKQASWFVNFDGLDEVPNDLKDRIAEEIIYFSNELIPSLDADVLILCSTRPQGYSGQFDDLDSCICNLLPLPEDIALACAEAVIRFNRSDTEAEQSVSILDAAMSSDQVKELMTTPLQSHIMAVVVRDGGRPPEKRWELFHNFYSVMKKRESLKDFPDKRISSLLREKEELLKSIHDRLGICLQVKAESSDGAEASLNKLEFKSLAQQATEILMDGDVKDTVDTLMEATIERLVFVNTPDNSENVRFDVRQLQEFFAGEFVINVLEDTSFQERFQMICEDAHWREVNHFILSALTHNKRHSTLAIAASILMQSDRDEEYKISYYKQKRANGALLTLRLIEEGVLEQNKQVRNLFSGNLLPLWGIVDSTILNRITKIRMEQSRNWCLNNMIVSFLSREFSDTVACGYLFSIMLTIKHERFNEVLTHLQSAPDSFWLTALSIFDRERSHSTNRQHQFWFVEFITKKYFSKDTSNEVLRRIYLYLSRNSTPLSSMINELNIPDSHKDFLNFLLPEEFDHSSAIDTDLYCFVSLVPCKYDWSKTTDFPLKVEDFCDREYSYPIELLKCAANFHFNKNSDNFKSILKLLKNNDFNIDAIPSNLLSMIPLSFEDCYINVDCEFFINSNDNTLDEFLSEKTLRARKLVPTFMYITTNNSEFNEIFWENLCLDYPDIALQLTLSSFFNADNIESTIIENPIPFFRPLLDLALSYPEYFSRYFSIYGEIFRLFPEHEENLRSLFLHHAQISAPLMTGRKIRISYFKINRVSELPFIISLATTIVKINSIGYMDFSNLSGNTGEKVDEKFLFKFGLDTDFLTQIYTNTSYDENLRAASLSLVLITMHTDKNQSVDIFFKNEMDKFIFELLSDNSQPLLTSAIFNFLTDINSIDEKLMEFLGYYSYLTRNNDSTRTILENIYSRWRERAGQVVLDSGQLNEWLKQ